MTDDSFRFAYSPSAVRYGIGATANLGDELAVHGVEHALVVTGRTVGTSDAVMGPVRDGLGNRLAGVFAETTPEKRLSTAIDAADAMAEVDADGFLAVGGGSSLDVAAVARVVAGADRSRMADRQRQADRQRAGDRSRADIREEMLAEGTITIPDAKLPALVAVPTTLAGAELSQGAGITIDPSDGRAPFSGGVSDPRLLPSTVLSDPALYATTPASVLTGSAMNGFDKGIETVYAKRATPITDATAVRGLQLLSEGLPSMAQNTTDFDAMASVVRGSVLVQYGTSRADGSTLSIIHAFGHALRDHAGVQQGVAHAVVAPHVLAFLLDRVDGRRELLAEGLGVPTDGKDDPTIATDVVAAVAAIRDALDQPTALAHIDGLTEDDLDEVARLVLEDRLWANAPADLEPSHAAIEAVLRRAWDPGTAGHPW